MIVQPKVTVMVMIYNSAKYLPACLDGLVNQTLKDFEVFMVDDASKDDSFDICKKYAEQDKRFRLIRFQENVGMFRSRASTLPQANGEYIAILDSDDLAYPTRLEKQAMWLDSNPNSVLVASYYQYIDSLGNPLPTIAKCAVEDIVIRWHLMFGNCLGHSTVMFRKKAGLECGGYSETITAGEDMEFYNRIMKLGDMGVVPEILGAWRSHDTSLQKTEPLENKKAFTETVRQSIQRHLGYVVPQELATAVFNNSGAPALNEDIFLWAVDLTYQAYIKLRDTRKLNSDEVALLKRCALIQMDRLRQRNQHQPWVHKVAEYWKSNVQSFL